MKVLVFETEVKATDYHVVKDTLKSLLVSCRWNFDFEDNQNILRVVVNDKAVDFSKRIPQTLKNLGFDCQELK